MRGAAATDEIMITRFKSPLGARILLAMGAAMLVSSLLFLSLLAPLYHRQLLREREIAPVKIGATLESALRGAMLRRDLDGLREMISDLGRSPGVAQATILNPSGEIRFASDPGKIGEKVPLASLCADCAAPDADGAQAGFLRNDRQQDVLRSLRPVHNQPACAQCHGEASAHPINGFLLIDFEAHDLRRHAFVTAAALAGAGALVTVLALLAAWFALRRLVLRPVARLNEAAAKFSQADFSARDKLLRDFSGRDDELAELAKNFVDMAENLDETIKNLRRQDVFLQNLIDAIPDGLRVIAPDHRVVAANRAFCRQSGRTLADVLAKPCYETSHGRFAPCAETLALCPLEKLCGEAPPSSVKCAQTHMDAQGRPHPVEVIAAPLGDEGLIVEAIRDLSQQAEISHEQRLSELGQLAAGVAHEIHNPLASIRLGLHAIRREVETHQSSAAALEFIAAANAEIDRSLTVTERLMKLSRVPQERGTLLDAGAALRDAAALLRYEAELRGVEILLDGDERARLIADESDLGMILVNLMQNALHALTSGGRLTLSARLDDAGDVEIAVADNGVGISAKNLEKIFQPFWSWRADDSRGSGLGLTICKALVNKWGGEISVKSRPGEGATFFLTFPHADKAVSDPT